ncbi:MAG: prepilin-type N-terminal cleavage/methylation domain-containing protein [Kiritimatiellae bacterium]|nr:prepilin-type N-terminal cleavage/methylation domain-containing protein [Kiritimatiellia bacterium]
MKNQDNNIKRIAKAGFTLAEIMIAVTIVGILAAIGVPMAMKFVDDSRITATQTKLRTLETVTDTYCNRHKIPSSQEAWSEALIGGDDPFFKGDLNDSWGTEIRFERKGRRYVLTSAGPDENYDTEDDITTFDASKNKKK